MTDRKPYQSDEPLKANTWWQCGKKTLFEKEPSVVTGWGWGEGDTTNDTLWRKINNKKFNPK